MTDTTSPNFPDPFLAPKEVAALLGVRVPTIWRWRRDGRFPHAVRLGPQRIGWRKSTIERWIDGQDKVEVKPAK